MMVVVINRIIAQAINDRRRLSFVYNGKKRIIEPQCYGIGTKGTELLRAHQLQGGQEREPLFDVSKMTDLVVLDQHFVRPGPNYKRNDSAMKIIFAQL
jgi:predicted DNA-binding transcriptional regulator YafY